MHDAAEILANLHGGKTERKWVWTVGDISVRSSAIRCEYEYNKEINGFTNSELLTF